MRNDAHCAVSEEMKPVESARVAGDVPHIRRHAGQLAITEHVSAKSGAAARSPTVAALQRDADERYARFVKSS